MAFDIFINYRAADAAFGAAASYELLSERFGRDRIFLDNQSIAPGGDYPRSLRSALESMRLLLVLIGPRWLDRDPTGDRLLIERDGDWVRLEIRRALARDVPIVPVLLDGAALPDPARLPDDIRHLVHRQAAEIRHQHLGADVDRLSRQLVDLLPPATTQVMPAACPMPRQLPADSGWFVGREAQTAQLDVLGRGLDEDGPRIAVISGTAGVGKTALAVRWARHNAHTFPDGQLFVDLRGYSTEHPLSPAEALAVLLRSLGVTRPEKLTDVEERAARYRSLLAGRRVLVMLDNARSVEQIRSLLPGGGPAAVVITSRHQLGGVAVHHAVEHVRLSPLQQGEAVDLLRMIIGERAAAEPEAVFTLAEQCATLPLALRIAAERAGARPTWRLGDLVAELTDERARLDVLDVGDTYSTMRTVLSWSYRGLDARATQAFRALGLHPGHTFDILAVAALTGTSRFDASAAVTALTEAHLVAELEPGRYSMHDLLCAYAREIADDNPDALRRLFDHYLHTANRADHLLTPHRFRIPLVGDPNAGVAIDDLASARNWLEQELGNLVAMCRVDRPAFDSYRWQLAFTLRGYFYLSKRLDDWMDSHVQALAACLRAGDRRGEAVTRNNLGMAFVATGRLADAMSHYQRAERIFESIGDQHGVSNALANQASVLRRQGSYAEALRCLRRSLAHYRRSGAQRNTGITLRSMARVHMDSGQLADAVRCAQEAVDVAVGLGHDLDVAQAYNVLGMVQKRAGDNALAEVATYQAVEFSRRCGSRHEEARAAHRLCLLAMQDDRIDEARRWGRVALDLHRELGSTEADLVAADLAELDER